MSGGLKRISARIKQSLEGYEAEAFIKENDAKGNSFIKVFPQKKIKRKLV